MSQPINDRITSWFVRNVILPKVEVMNHPGYIISKFSSGAKESNLREFFVPEKIYANFEEKIVQKFEDQGKQVLYSILIFYWKKIWIQICANRKFCQKK